MGVNKGPPQRGTVTPKPNGHKKTAPPLASKKGTVKFDNIKNQYKGMRFYQSLPKNAPFFQYYAGLIPTLFRVGYLSQMFSAAIELYIMTSILQPKFAGVTDHAAAAALTCAALLVALLEGGLRTGAAYSVRAILYKKFRGLDLVMSVTVWALFLSLLVCSLTLHVEGAKEAVTANAAPPALEHSAPIEAAANVELAAIARSFSQDSAAIMATTAAQLGAVRNETRARERAAMAQRGGTYSDAMQVRSEGAAKVAALEQDRAAQIAAAVTRKNAAVDAARNRRDAAAARIEGRNDASRETADTKTERYSGYLSTFSVLVVFFFLLTIGLNEVNKKGSEIETVAILSQYQFEPGVISKAWAAVVDKFQYHARHHIDKLEQRTPQPAQPLEPHPLFNWGAIEQGKAALITRPRIAPDIADAARQQAAQAYNKNTGGGVSKTMPAPARDNAMSSEQERGTVEVDTSLKPCRKCSRRFRPRTTWQVYCSNDCKLADHEARHGARFSPSKAKYINK